MWYLTSDRYSTEHRGWELNTKTHFVKVTLENVKTISNFYFFIKGNEIFSKWPVIICNEEDWRPDYYDSFVELESKLNFNEFRISDLKNDDFDTKVVSLLSVRTSQYIIYIKVINYWCFVIKTHGNSRNFYDQ